MTKTEPNEPSRFSGGDSFITHRANIVCRLKKWKSQPCFVTKSVKFRSFEVFLVPLESSRRDLQSGHGFEACFWKNKRKKLDFRTFGGQKSEKKTKIRTKFVKFWFPELWMGAKRCGRPARMVFQTTRPEKPWKKQKNPKISFFFPVVSVDLAQNGQNTRTNGWSPDKRLKQTI